MLGLKSWDSIFWYFFFAIQDEPRLNQSDKMKNKKIQDKKEERMKEDEKIKFE
jgi:hypothetical protein